MKSFCWKMKKAIENPRILMLYLLGKPLINRVFPDKAYLKLKYRLTMGKKLDLNPPESFNEKLQWLKLYNPNNEYRIITDKYLRRKYIAEKIGEEYLVPLLGVWDRAEDIDFDKLPDKFVLKCTHNSGLGMCICKDKSKLDIGKVRKELNRGLKEKYFYGGREWCYKNIKPRIIAEKYLTDESGTELKDYKFMCFGGRAECLFVCSERFGGGLRVTFFDREWNRLPFERKYPASENEIDKPKNFEKMIELAECLSQNIPFTRVDFYNVDGKIYFGEMTFYPGSGFEEFTPEIWDYKLGDLIDLEAVKKQNLRR